MALDWGGRGERQREEGRVSALELDSVCVSESDCRCVLTKPILVVCVDGSVFFNGCVSTSYPVLFVFEGDLEVLCGFDHRLHGGEDVLVHQPDETPLVLLCVARPVDDPHLLDECTLPTLSCTWSHT